MGSAWVQRRVTSGTARTEHGAGDGAGQDSACRRWDNWSYAGTSCLSFPRMKQSSVAFVEVGENAESTRLRWEQQRGLAGPGELSECGCRQNRAGKGRLDPVWHRGG